MFDSDCQISKVYPEQSTSIPFSRAVTYTHTTTSIESKSKYKNSPYFWYWSRQ